jgi:hypothetical protein
MQMRRELVSRSCLVILASPRHDAAPAVRLSRGTLMPIVCSAAS